ncbi:type II secretion system protein (plasmid) [Deinococcus metallilatus]|uniref:Type II secretion system protein n=1 Tax=Deinococcus metallilatus TaxID=1211322 RepID=A0AAJ5F7D0_9DEIO|nr:type II secretion system protein [Deinococcus metallilatus]MBB5293411.1 type IV pilus assembly protein PilA [Deinococcus metallilatus]QBY06505.1 type II secretion system protein [Deinococcus metallilatus]RXJ17848.1 type II secretion system protein [Deinococcus metallilatus]TLK32120.1 type II secretion system protein [Deinococcus metallilatus]GMA15368.1 hypothetical protein GCM10025871_16990 [Deinococcus metallilatus]
MKNGTQGFTLIELLIVIAIIGILAAVLIPNLLGARKRAYDTASINCGKALQVAETAYQGDKRTYGKYADLDTDLLTACTNTTAGTITVTDKTNTDTAYSFTVKAANGKNTYLVTQDNIQVQ